MTADTGRRAGARPSRVVDIDSARLFDLYAERRELWMRDELVERHRWLARVCARQMLRRREPLDELEQVALIGIFKAVERFNPDLGVQFRTYASVTALGELRRHYRDCGWTVRVPRSVKEHFLQVQQAVNHLTGSLCRSPASAEVASWLGITVEEVLTALEADGAMHPQTLLPSHGGPRRVAGDEDPVLDACLTHIDDRAVVQRLLRRLDPQRRRVVTLRFFAHMTQQEIGEVVGVSQVQISRILRSALVEMRDDARVLASTGTE